MRVKLLQIFTPSLCQSFIDVVFMILMFFENKYLTLDLVNPLKNKFLELNKRYHHQPPPIGQS